MRYLFFDTAINDYYTLLMLKKECQNWLPLLSKGENISDDAAPFLFDISEERLASFLSAEHIFFKEILFVESNETMAAVRDYFNRFTVQTIKGKPFYFRFWAANVFTKYIATCNAKQLADFFKIVDKFSCEEEGRAVQFSFDGKKLVTERATDKLALSDSKETLPHELKAPGQNEKDSDDKSSKTKSPRKFFT